MLVPTASVLNGVVRSLLTSPERGSFKPARPRTSSNTLISQAFNNRTKMGVVRLCQRKGGERARKRSEIGLPAGPRGSDEWPQMPAFCGVPAADDHREKNVPTGETGGGRGTVVEPSLLLFQWVMNHTNYGGCCLENRRPTLAVFEAGPANRWMHGPHNVPLTERVRRCRPLRCLAINSVLRADDGRRPVRC
jgi:hypothetical protein